MYKVIVAHPERQHSFHTAKALYDHRILYKYMTTLYVKKGTLLGVLSNIVGENNKKKILSRRCEYFPDDCVIVKCEFQNLFCRLIEKFIDNKKIRKKLYLWMVNSFGKKVAKYAIKNNVDAVIMYDETAKECFKILKSKAPRIKRILDVSTGNRLYIKNIYEKDMIAYNHRQFYCDFPYLWNNTYIQYCQEETSLTEYFIFPSLFVKNSYIDLNPRINRYSIIPYGVDAKLFPNIKRTFHDGSLRLIFVGQISTYKGLHHLLNVMSELEEKDITLKLVGKYSTQSYLYKKYKDLKKVEFCGFINFKDLPKYYQNADVFVFPTMGEGFGLVVLEAMSTGLSVICSKNAGGNDVILDHQSGFIYDPLNEDELKKYILWCFEHKNKLTSFGEKSKIEAQKYSWERYYSSVYRAICDFMK